MKFKFEDLLIWQKAMDLGEEINTMIKDFPMEERFNLSSQMMRAMDSVALNISEGAIGQSNPQFKKYMGYSIGSLSEVVTCLHKAKRRSYIGTDEFEKQYLACFDLMNMMTAFRKRIK